MSDPKKVTELESVVLDYTSFVENGLKLVPRDAGFLDKALERRIRSTQRSGLCPYCRAKYERVYEERWEPFRFLICHSCLVCGWWWIEREESEDWGARADYAVAILRQFDISDKRLPISTLEMELRRRPHLIRTVHPHVLEKLVESVLRDFFHTEVYLIGKSGDGGVDLLYLDADVPVAIQVKRRRADDVAEGVSLVREFLGAMVLLGIRRGTVVSTARSFTRGAREVAQSAVEKFVVDTFELVDCRKFLDIFRLASKRANYPWEEVLYERAKFASRIGPGGDSILVNKSTILEKNEGK